jgi:uncharacterized protein (DUF433 family)
VPTSLSKGILWFEEGRKRMEPSDAALLERITVNPDVLVGKPTIRGVRISVVQILRALSAGVTKDELLADLPELEEDDIRAVLAYAAEMVSGELVCPIRPTGT